MRNYREFDHLDEKKEVLREGLLAFRSEKGQCHRKNISIIFLKIITSNNKG